ncbi:hypothetical protein Tco_0527114 [Tanacetum coccineum]
MSSIMSQRKEFDLNKQRALWKGTNGPSVNPFKIESYCVAKGSCSYNCSFLSRTSMVLKHYAGYHSVSSSCFLHPANLTGIARHQKFSLGSVNRIKLLEHALRTRLNEECIELFYSLTFPTRHDSFILSQLKSGGLCTSVTATRCHVQMTRYPDRMLKPEPS